MLSGSRIILLFAFLLVLSACGDMDDKTIISRSYHSHPDSSISFNMIVQEDSMSLDIPNTLMGYDSVMLYFPASKKEIRGTGETKENSRAYLFRPEGIDILFKRNDSIQVIFKKKHLVIYRPTLYKFSDTIVPGDRKND